MREVRVRLGELKNGMVEKQSQCWNCFPSCTFAMYFVPKYPASIRGTDAGSQSVVGCRRTKKISCGLSATLIGVTQLLPVQVELLCQ